MPKRQPAASERRVNQSLPARRRYAASALVMLGGLVASLTTYFLQRSAEIYESQERFATWAEERRALLQKAFDANAEILYGVRALFDSSEFVSAQEFDRYTAEFLERHPHIHSLDWLPRVPRSQRAAFERRASEQLGIEYRIRDEPMVEVGALRSGESFEAAGNDYWPILYTQARDGLRRAGLDASSRRETAAAMSAAARADEASAAIIRLQPSPNEPPVERFHIYLPIYERAPAQPGPGTVLGFVASSFSTDNLLDATLSAAAREGIAVELVDPQDGAILGSMTPIAQAGRRISAPNPELLNWSSRLQAADRALALRFAATPGYAGHPKLAPIWVLLAVSLIVTALGSVAAYHLTRRRLRLQLLTQKLLAENAERRRSEQLLSRSEARYRVLVENSPDAIFLHKDGRITFANGACVRLLRAGTAERLVGRSIFDIVHPDFHEAIRERMRAVAGGPRVLPPIEHKLVRTDGAEVDVEVLSLPFETEGGVTMQVTARDITRRKAAEAEGARLEAALRQSQKLEAVGALAGGIAHDFNNILSAIVGNTRLLLEDLSEQHAGWRYTQEIRNATRRARDLVKRLMAFSRQQEAQRTPVQLAPLLSEVQQLLRATLPAGIVLDVHIAADTPAIFADATQIHQVLLNLCTNAWQAMPSNVGRIDITVETIGEKEACARSGAALHGASRYVCIGVHDNGGGISPETMEHIFDPFFTTKQPGEGSGLGLAVAHGIVQSHKGAIQASSEPGKGTSFFIYLPACERAPPQAESAPGALARGAQQHILYIDDEEPLVFLVQRMLERAGYRCTGEMDVASAIEAVRTAPQSFDLAITDLNMPGMSGLDVAREILSIRRDLPVVITTGYVRAADVAAARELGVRDVILKPDTIDELTLIVQKHLAEMHS